MWKKDSRERERGGGVAPQWRQLRGKLCVRCATYLNGKFSPFFSSIGPSHLRSPTLVRQRERSICGGFRCLSLTFFLTAPSPVFSASLVQIQIIYVYVYIFLHVFILVYCNISKFSHGLIYVYPSTTHAPPASILFSSKCPFTLLYYEGNKQSFEKKQSEEVKRWW